MANYSSAKRTSRDRVFICFVLGAGATAAAIVTASALAPHPPVAPCGPGVPHDLIAQSGQGLPSFPEIVDAIGGSGRLDPRRQSLDEHWSSAGQGARFSFG
jgi:hypothetical protein